MVRPERPLTQAEQNVLLEQRSRQELRNNALVPILVMWGSDVPNDASQAALQGVRDVLGASGQSRELLILGSRQFANGDYSSADWYISETFRTQELRRDVGFGPQLAEDSLRRLFYNEPWQQNPHWEVMIVNQDLNSRMNGRYLNFVFGSTDTMFPASIQSVRRISEEVREPQLRYSLVRRLLRHEVGHMFGLPGYNRPNLTENLGIHCTNICTMRQGLDTAAWSKQNREEERAGVKFCTDCTNYLIQQRAHYRAL